MTQYSVFTERFPQSWRLDGDDHGRRLCFGWHSIAVADISRVEAEEIRDRPFAGTLLVAVVFIFMSAVFAFGVFEAEMRTRFLIGTALLGFLGYMGLTELKGLRQQNLFEVRIEQRDGRVVTYSTADRAQAERLLSVLSNAP